MTTVTQTLTEFLLARIAEDEVAVRRATDFPYSIQSTPWGKTFDIVADAPDSRADHWLTVDPARVLAECEAKRRIVLAARDLERGMELTSYLGEEPESAAAANAYEFVLRELATIYADHPDYRDEWRP